MRVERIRRVHGFIEIESTDSTIRYDFDNWAEFIELVKASWDFRHSVFGPHYPCPYGNHGCPLCCGDTRKE